MVFNAKAHTTKPFSFESDSYAKYQDFFLIFWGKFLKLPFFCDFERPFTVKKNIRKEIEDYNKFKRNKIIRLDRPGFEPGTSRLRVRSPSCAGAKI